jgi:hypothetical protein
VQQKKTKNPSESYSKGALEELMQGEGDEKLYKARMEMELASAASLLRSETKNLMGLIHGASLCGFSIEV